MTSKPNAKRPTSRTIDESRLTTDDWKTKDPPARGIYTRPFDGAQGKHSSLVNHFQACPEAILALVDIYARLAAETADAGATCDGCGRCCDFARAGHRLFVSTGELALLIVRPPP